MNIWTILIPILAATIFLVVGGWIALFWIPPIIQSWLHPNIPPEHIGKAELGLLFGFVLALMPATHYAKASYLMGSFLAGLSFFVQVMNYIQNLFNNSNVSYNGYYEYFLLPRLAFKFLSVILHQRKYYGKV